MEYKQINHNKLICTVKNFKLKGIKSYLSDVLELNITENFAIIKDSHGIKHKVDLKDSDIQLMEIQD